MSEAPPPHTSAPRDDRVRPEDRVRIGPYVTVRELGRGGQAIVWLAEDVRIGRQVALKVLPFLGPGGEEALVRFRREAEVAARLEHPAICAVLEADLDAGVPYIAMRYVAGETLARRIACAKEKGDALPSREELLALAELFEKIARALHVAHEAGIVHRDVKPANLMVTPDGEPVVLDFGLARQDDAHAASLSGDASGTPAYMSPEQMTGRARADRRTDVWSLGVALFEAATHAHPFASPTREALFQAILDRDPPSASSINPAIDRDLATILETATAKERDKRYQTALLLAEDLRRWRANEPIAARRVGNLERARRWAERKPALALSLLAILLLFLGAAALLAYGLGASSRAETERALRAQAETERTAAETARATAESERRRADEARATLERVALDKRLFDEIDELNMITGTLWFGFEARSTIPALVPKYFAAFARGGIALDGDAQVVLAELAAMRERNVELADACVDALRDVAWIAVRDDANVNEATRKRVLAIVAGLPDSKWPELQEALQRWEAEKVDTFDSLLVPAALEGRTSDELYSLAGALLIVPARLGDAQSILERALRNAPGSFRLNFLVAALGFMQMSSKTKGELDPELVPTYAPKVLHQMEIATALRPRSGFVRAMLASAQAINGRYEDAGRSIDAATKLEPDNALVWLLRARFYAYSPYPQPGIEACKKALELDPTIGGAKELLESLEARAAPK